MVRAAAWAASGSAAGLPVVVGDKRGGKLLGRLAAYFCAPLSFLWFWRLSSCPSVIWPSGPIGLTGVGAAAWAASGSAAGLPEVVGDKGPGGGAGRGRPWGHVRKG